MFQFTIANSTLRNIPRFRKLRRRWSFRLFKQSRFILISPFEFLLDRFYKFLLIDSIRITFYISLTWIRLCSRASFFSLAVSWSFAIWSNFSKSLFKILSNYSYILIGSNKIIIRQTFVFHVQPLEISPWWRPDWLFRRRSQHDRTLIV